MNKKLLFIVLTITTINFLLKGNDNCPCKNTQKNNISTKENPKNNTSQSKIETKTLNQIIKNYPIIINVLAEKLYKKCHIPGSINIPLEKIINSSKEWSKNRSIFLYCLFETHSTQAYNLLRNEGFYRTKIIKGGLNQWIKDKLEIKGDFVNKIPLDKIIEKLYEEANKI